MQIDIVQVATSLARSTKTQSSVTIIGAFSDMMRHLRKIIHCSLNDSELGEEIIQWNRKFHRVIDECLVELSYKVGLHSKPVIYHILMKNTHTHTHIAQGQWICTFIKCLRREPELRFHLDAGWRCWTNPGCHGSYVGEHLKHNCYG